jgi:hypothetical protein
MYIDSHVSAAARTAAGAGQSRTHDDHARHHAHHDHAHQDHAHHNHMSHDRPRAVSWAEAGSATLHCLLGCAIGEVSGLIVGTAIGLGNGATIALAVALAFVFGFALTMRPLLRAGLPVNQALRVAFAADAVSITVMEVVDNAVMLAVPGAMDAALTDALFWATMIGALAVAGLAAWPVNRWLIARGKGHAVVHAFHHHH